MNDVPHERRDTAPAPERPTEEEPRVPTPRGDDVREPEPPTTAHAARHGAPTHARPGSRPPGTRLPALVGAVVIAVACLAGLIFQMFQFAGHIRVFPWAAVLALAFATATLAFGFWILRGIRPVRAPAPVPSAVAAVWGMTAATGAGIIANGGLGAVWSKLLGLGVTGAWDAALTAPVNEELLKLAGIVLVAVVFPRALRGPVDGFVLGALVGLGFEVTENLIYAFQSVTRSGATDPALAVATTTIVRIGLTGLGS
ncbi:PrsW family glutamic-type intramembrane protease, partial [Nocardiopsis lucentensis]|uniref:PrsW family glutamic-type intramembrane protease n=1 Tax=Nocardiopsis lucentensis TaxID=53441 RepID=UPI0003775218